MGIKPPLADDSMRTSTGGRHGFGASALLLTKASLTGFPGAKGTVIMPKLIKLVGPSLTTAEELSP